MKNTFENGILTFYPEGRIDSSNAASVQSEINALLDKKPQSIILDGDNLEYISSAGLRVILSIRKAYSDFKLINISAEVYDIFDMTGFTEMLTIEKAYRRFSVDGCEMIGQGSNGMVYRIDDDTVIKVYRNPDALNEIKRERELARKAFILGIPTAIPYDVVRVGNSYGSVFELLNASSFAKLINDNPDTIDDYIKIYADLLKKTHSTSVGDGELPSVKETALGWIDYLKPYLDGDIWSKLYKLVDEIPESNGIIHGDFHIGNIKMQNGEALIIDMDTLSVGNPVFEFASVFLAYKGFSETDHKQVESFLGISYDTADIIWNRVLKFYLNTEDERNINAAKEKAMCIGYARLMRRTIKRIGFDNPDGARLIEICKQHLNELVPKQTSLAY